MHRLYRHPTDKVIGGVAAGLGVWMNVDPTIVRLAWVVLAIFTGGIFLVIYFVMLFVVPLPPQGWVPGPNPGGPVPGQPPSGRDPAGRMGRVAGAAHPGCRLCPGRAARPRRARRLAAGPGAARAAGRRPRSATATPGSSGA